jgi:formylglycine-generating enzyme required for sulfatase activity
MQEPELLQKQRQNLRLFRQAAANREQKEKNLADNYALEKTQADNIQNNAQSKADKLQERAHHAYMSAQDETRKSALRGLDAILPLLVEVPANPLPQRLNNEPEVELDHAVSFITSMSLQFRSSLALLDIWKARRRQQNQFLIALALVIVGIALAGGYQLYGAWQKEEQYQLANTALEAGEWEEARHLFTELGGYQDSQTLLKETHYQLAKTALEAGNWEEARRLFTELGDYQDSQTLLKETYYELAKIALEAGNWQEARRLSIELGDYQGSRALLEEATYQLVMPAIETNNWDAVLSLTGNSSQELLHLVCPPPSEPSLGDTWQRCSDGMTLVYVPGGRFMMGSVDGNLDERPEHEVTLAGFWLDKTEVTNKMYGQCAVAGICRISSYATNSKFNGENQPVVGVSWHNANAYCEWVGGKLPTEAQWEYSARGPDGNNYPWGNNPPNKDLANYSGHVEKTTDVGSYPSGASWVGAVDMAGNVKEWVADWYSSAYQTNAPLNNPTGPESGTTKVLRGGSWYSGLYSLRVASRYNIPPSSGLNDVGFRCVSAPGK